MTYDSLKFCVADLYFELESRDIPALKSLIPSYAGFHVADIPSPNYPIFKATIDNQLVDCLPEGEELGQFDSCGTNHGVYRLPEIDGGGYKIVISNYEKKKAAAMRTNGDFSRIEISPFGTYAEQLFGLGNALMIAYAFSAAYYGTLLIHASVIRNNNRGYLFLGKSGTGKSTHSRLWLTHIPGSDLLNDDNPAIRVLSDDLVKVYGTPWSGKTPCYRNLSVPIGAFVRLEQYPANIIEKERPIQSYSSILSSVSSMIWDKPSYQHILSTTEKVVRNVSTFYLKCKPDQEAAELSFKTITA